MTDNEHGTDLDTQDARGGVTGNGVRYVLFWSLGGAVIAMIIVALVFHVI